MFVIIDGAAEVTSPDGKVVYATLSMNAFFGEVCMFYDVPRTATVKAKVHTTVLELSKESLKSALEEYPELKETIMKAAQENFELFRKRQSAGESKLDRQNTEELEIATVIERLKKVCFNY
jgi:F-box/leucine-rich repeat protein 7